MISRVSFNSFASQPVHLGNAATLVLKTRPGIFPSEAKQLPETQDLHFAGSGKPILLLATVLLAGCASNLSRPKDPLATSPSIGRETRTAPETRNGETPEAKPQAEPDQALIDLQTPDGLSITVKMGDLKRSLDFQGCQIHGHLSRLYTAGLLDTPPARLRRRFPDTAHQVEYVERDLGAQRQRIVDKIGTELNTGLESGTLSWPVAAIVEGIYNGASTRAAERCAWKNPRGYNAFQAISESFRKAREARERTKSPAS